MKKNIFCFALLILLTTTVTQAQCPGNAINFTATNFSGVSGALIPSVSNNFTMEFWVKPSKTILPGMIETNQPGFYAGTVGQNYAVFPTHGWEYGGVYPNHTGAGISVGTNGVAVFEHADGYIPPILVFYTPISSVNWTHIAVVYTARNPSLYINGLLVRTSPFTSIITNVHPSATLGLDYLDDLLYGPFGGSIDEFRIWNTSLSSATIGIWHNLHADNSHPDIADLYSYWKLDEGTGTTTADATGNGRNGTLINGAAWTSSTIALRPFITVSVGTDENTYYGYSADQCVTKTALVTAGTAPATYNWTLNRALLPGETMTGGNTATVTICLMDNAELCVTATVDAACTASDCAMIFAEDVRCVAGNSSGEKVQVCHNGNVICVDQSAVSAHMNHGDDLGICGGSISILTDPNGENLKPGLNVYPNPAKGAIQITVNTVDDSSDKVIRIVTMNGQTIKTLNIAQQHRISTTIEKPGVYMVQLISGKQIITKKLVVIE